MQTPEAKIIELLIKSERIADKILQNKQEIIVLSKRREDNRMAIRELDKSDHTKNWLTVGSILMKMDKEKALELLRTDQIQISAEINKLRSDEKVLVNELRDLEYCTPLKGFDLKPLDKQEVSAFKSNMPGF